MFLAVQRVSGPVIMFCAPEHIFSGTEVVRSRFHVLPARTRFNDFRSRTSFQRYGECRVPFSCFALTDSFSTVPSASAPVFMFCEPELIFDGTKGVGSRFHVLRYRIRFRRNGGRRVSISCFVLPDSFSAVPRAPGPVFMFCAPKLIFDGTKGVGSRFHVLRYRTRFRRYGGRRVSISCYALPDSFLALPRALVPVFIFCAPDSFSAVPKD
jgi:hypothetical protein